MRLEKWVCGEKVIDSTSTNEYSEWVDSFEPKNHQHIWQVGTLWSRSEWFGPSSIGCGGSPVIPTIYSRRKDLGEQTAQRLVAKFHEFVRSPNFRLGNLKEQDDFLEVAIDDLFSVLEGNE